ncbi:MAG: glycine cleavage system protein GcvH [Candidatus Marinimicrobia bacterium]|jgi:glycine cleavage system H protein|nr:glycine cleavage system protein GcvH [Candidatus Neomarinimicrobiota bacterium]MDP6852386.1 glycine cleavage system protein GcvH [Candidatus Neomarinimicrobiota bacterium]
MNIPDHLKYTKDHEWIELKDGIATIGITDFAQGELGDIIFVEFPDIDVQAKAGDSIGTIEAVKTVADIFTPLDGTVVEVNSALGNNPELTNTDPYGTGWMIKLKDVSEGDVELLTAAAYKEIIS